MKKTILYSIAVAGLAFLSGCSDDLGSGGNGSGSFNPQLTLDTDPANGQTTDIKSRATNVTADDLKLTLTSHTGKKYTWESVADFDATREFPVGTYTLEASYGAKTTEGFDAPHFYGTTQFVIRENTTTPVALTAKYGNSLISVEYTEAFRGYFADFTTKFTTTVGNTHEYASTETRPLHVSPGRVSISVSATDRNGKKANYEVSAFTAVAATHYHLLLNVNGGNVGSSTLTLTFDDMPEIEDVVINLDQNLTNTPAPVLEPDGFENNGNILCAAGSEPMEPALVAFNAPGGFASVVMETFCPALTKAGWPETIDLVAAGPEEKAILQKYGFIEKGIWTNPQVMAVVDFSEVLSNIPYSEVTNNESTFKLTMTDHLGQTSEAVFFTVTIERRVITLSNPSKVLVEDTSMSFDLASNGKDIEDVAIQYRNNFGTWDDLKIVKQEAVSRSIENVYRVAVEGLASDDRDVILRAVIMKNDELFAQTAEDLTVVRTPLPYTLIGDDRNAFSTYALLNLQALEEAADQAAARAKMYLSTDGGTTFKEYPVKAQGDILRVEGLTSGQTYVARITVDGQKSTRTSFTTEIPYRLPNRNMETWDRTDGLSKYWWLSMPYLKDTTEPHWDTYNPVTISQGGSGTSMFDHKGCAYCATSGTQSTTDSHTGNAAVIRTVGWGSSNSAAASGTWSFGTCKYVSAGQLFLGSWMGVNPVYEAVPAYGVPCQARPKSLTFWYKYSQMSRSGNDNGDYGTAYIEVFDAAGNPITEAQEVPLIPTPAYEEKTITLNYPLLSAKAASIQVTFKSSGNKACQVANENYMRPPERLNLSDGEYVGSSLYIDDLKLNY